jgi:hypothetical protein
MNLRRSRRDDHLGAVPRTPGCGDPPPETGMVMSIPGARRRELMLAAMVAILAFGTTIEARAEIDHYRDTLMPNGRARNMAAKQADMRACGAINGIVTDEDFPRANACMKAHGWMLDGVVHDRPPQGDSPNDPADPMWQTCPFVANC